MDQNFSRRKFIQTLMAGVAMGPAVLARQQHSPAGLPTRPLGNTGLRVSIIGYGGWHCNYRKNLDEAIAMMHEAVDQGINFFDNAWEYHDGVSEEFMGAALGANPWRDRIILMTKVCARDYKGVREQVEQSLRRLRTDRIDLLQFHAIQYDGDARRIFDPEKGGMRAVQEMITEGKVHFVGFSGHMDPADHLSMLDTPFEWHSVQMPLNIMDAHTNSFQHRVLPLCNQRNIAALGMKSLVGRGLDMPSELNVSVELCRRYAMSLPVSTVICGMTTPEEMRGMLEIARDFRPLTEAQIEDLLVRSKPASADMHLEQYKNRQGGYGCSHHDKVLRGEKS